MTSGLWSFTWSKMPIQEIFKTLKKKKAFQKPKIDHSKESGDEENEEKSPVWLVIWLTAWFRLFLIFLHNPNENYINFFYHIKDFLA